MVIGDVSRPQAITVDWAKYAQSLTDKPVKGMLTGPVTILWDDADPRRLQIRHFITQGQRNLFRDGFTADILPREGPAQNGHRGSASSRLMSRRCAKGYR